MSWFQRVHTNLRADAHGVVDALEDQALLLKQCLRDAESEVQRKRARLVLLEADWKRLTGERERAQAEAERAEGDVQLAIAQGRDDLARYTLKQVLTQRNLSERLALRMTATAEEQKELSQALQTQQVALEELRTRVQAFLSAREGESVGASLPLVTEEQIEIELLRRKAGVEPQAASTEQAHGEK
ncbi:MAG: PspA/IM30 family protein [Polyangiaceae bacterium]